MYLLGNFPSVLRSYRLSVVNSTTEQFLTDELAQEAYDHVENLLIAAFEHVIGLPAFRYPEIYNLGDGSKEAKEANSLASLLLGVVGDIHITTSVDVSIVLQFVHDWTYSGTICRHVAGFSFFSCTSRRV